MDEILFYGVALLAFVIGVPIYLLIAMSRLKARVSELEARLAAPAQAPAVPERPEAAEIEQQAARVKAETPPPPQPKSAWAPTPKVKRQRKAFVFSGGRVAQLVRWAQDNWVFILAGVSLALAGVFLVQYGVENGLLTPQMRVLGALGLGLALIGLGEYIRRKSRGDETGSFALLPSVFAGAGLVSVFAGVLAAHMLYGLIGQNFAFGGLALTGAIAVLLGWVYGPLLAMLGVFGALLAPFLLGGNADDAGPLHLYFALIAVVALGIDAYKHWAWLSALGLIGAFAASWMLLAGGDTGFYAVLFAFLVALLAVAVPVLSLTPSHSGPRITAFLTKSLKSASPAFPTRVASGAYLAASLYIGWAYAGDASLFWLVLMVLGLLLLAAIFWMKDAPALADIAFVPPIVALYVIAVEAMRGGAVAVVWVNDATRDVLDSPSPTVAYLLLGATLASLAFAWRSYFRPPLKIANAVMAAGFAPWVAILIEMHWFPSHVLGSTRWALYLAVVAAVMVGLTERFARLEREGDRTRTALFALSAISMVSFMLMVLLGDVALTLSLAVMVLAAAWLGARFRLWLMDWYVQAGAILLSYRLVVDPGLDWALDAPLWQVLLAYLGVIGLLAVALWVRRGGKLSVLVVLESVVWSLGGILASLLLLRWLDATHSDTLAYVPMSFSGVVWLMLAANQLYRLKAGGRLQRLRIVLAAVYGVVAVLQLGAAVVINPAATSYQVATGWPVFGSLGAAYLLPVLLFGLMAWRFAHLPRWLRVVFWLGASAFAALFVALEIRHFWMGDHMASSRVLQPELYSYTVAMVLASAGLFALAFMRQSPVLRKLALGAVVLVVAKVYLVDMSELDGLLLVVSFLVLGLVAAVMAWVNRLLKANEAKRAA